MSTVVQEVGIYAAMCMYFTVVLLWDIEERRKEFCGQLDIMSSQIGMLDISRKWSRGKVIERP